MKPDSLTIRANSRDAQIGDLVLPCRIGRGGAIDQARGREGDEKTPLGDYKLRFGLYRPDRLPAPPSTLTFWPMQETDGWCDDPNHPAYNRFIRLPSDVNHETLWREDGVYDIVLVIDHNDSPPTPGLGSAVFIHIAQADDRQTLGCVAFAPDDMVRLLPRLRTGMPVMIQE